MRKTAGSITPIIQRLTYGTLPLAVKESCIMLEALAEEIERDDVATVQEAAAL
ncbi:hypothetical protein [Acetobacter senegalensis]|uniref:hypothetical protein n=1 Tax=Acetobacter senegalensis TaxID=446692 RepID=UPI002652454C|nr:hypothetical protein [Acetobacter senegalensis]MDN7354377.1 hypothetical protein [Acetobacter senegalensis]